MSTAAEQTTKRNKFAWLDKDKPFISYLVMLRKQYNTNFKQFFTVTGISLVVFIVIAALIDIFTPFTQLFMVLRSLMLIPGSLLFFSLLYNVSIFLSNVMKARDPQWIPFRFRLSYAWRVRIAIVAAVFLIVLIYGGEFDAAYTARSALYASLFLSLLAFIRMTSKEADLRKYGIPDPRDIENKRKTYEMRSSLSDRGTRRKNKKR